MKKPKMILFDYGNTLLREKNINFSRGYQALFPYITKNPRQVTPEEMEAVGEGLYHKCSASRKAGVEVHQWRNQQFLCEYLGIEFELSDAEVEKILWDHTSEGAQMPYVTEMLRCLKDNGIRSGVISNIGWSGHALAERINRLLPDNSFEFILASSDYIYRKPDPMLFELALRKAGLPPEDVWYCGDKIEYDIDGAKSVGMFPVLYEDLTVENPWKGQNDGWEIDVPHLHIHDWRKLIDILEGITEASASLSYL